VEFLYVLEGTLELHVGDQEQKLDAGDAIYFDSQVPHAYRRAGTRSCRAVVITAP
jgi:quercetin dioxygenase-like cupin family protein